jgi:hypothetical protein
MINRTEYSRVLEENKMLREEIAKLQWERREDKTNEIIKLLKENTGLGGAEKINREIAEKVGCSIQHVYAAKRTMRVIKKREDNDGLRTVERDGDCREREAP